MQRNAFRADIAAVQECLNVGDLLVEVRHMCAGLLQRSGGGAQLRVVLDAELGGRPRDEQSVDLVGGRGFGLLLVACQPVPDAMSGAAQPEVDASRIKRVENTEALHHRRGGGGRDLDSARADADPVGGSGDMRDHQRGDRARHRDEVVLSQPVTTVSPLFGVLGQVDRVAQCRGGIGPFADWGEVENREWDVHADFLA
ncbi:Uncharacterised protein [Mycobacteroides abscessus]|nr:Uncharacterised protein [Mycobacteroides abscessus]